jgi:hypothetical protein
MKGAVLAVCAVLLAVGCATPRRPAPLATADIIAMTKAGMTDEEIMRRIDETRSVFRLSSDDVVRLRNDGVSGRVIDYMLETYTRAAVEQERRYEPYGRPYFEYYWCGYCRSYHPYYFSCPHYHGFRSRTTIRTPGVPKLKPTVP